MTRTKHSEIDHLPSRPGVYSIKNLINGKVYIGSAAISIRKRIRAHIKRLRENRHNNKHLQRSYIKHGESQFRFSVVEECTANHVLECEQYWIDELKVTNPKIGYNKAPIAGSTLGVKWSEEDKLNLKAILKIANSKPESKKNRSTAAKESYDLVPGLREIRRETSKRIQANPEYKKRHSSILTKIFNKPEIKEKRSKAQKISCAKPEIRAAKIEHCRKNNTDPIIKEKRKRGVSDSWKDPEIRKKRVEGLKRAWIRKKERRTKQ